MIVQELVARLKFDTSAGLRVAENAYRRVQSVAQSTTDRMTRAIQRLSGITAREANASANAQIQAANRATSIIERNAQKMANARIAAESRVKNAVMAGMAALGAAGIGAAVLGGKQILSVATEYERLTAALVTVTGSQRAAFNEFKRLEKFAAETPFKLSEVVTAFTRMKNMGLDPSNRAIISYGNTAGAMGKSLMQMIEAVADAVTGEFERLKEFGIKASKNGDKITFTFKNIKTTVKNDAREIEKYLIGIGASDFAGGMDRQAQTVGGRLSTLQDAVDSLSMTLWTSALDKPFKSAVESAIRFANTMQSVIKTNVIPIRNAVNAITVSFRVFGQVLRVVHSVIPFVAAGLYVLAVRFALLKAQAAATWIMAAVSAIQSMGVAAAASSAAMTVLNGAVAFLPTLIAAAVVAVAGFVIDTVNYFKTGKSVLLDFTAQWPWLQNAIKTVMNFAIWAFFALYEGIRRGVDFWMPALVNAFNFWRDVVVNVFNTIRQHFGWLIDSLKTIGGLASSAFQAVSGMIAGGAQTQAMQASGAGAVTAGASMAAVAASFAAGAPGQSAADKWAFSSARSSGFLVRDLYKQGRACAISAKEVARRAGASQQVLNSMTAAVGTTFQNLVNKRLADVVPYNQLQGGELFIERRNGIMAHIGVVGQGGKTFYHASTTAGKQIGMGQRFVQTSNYLGSRGIYLRIRPEHMGGGGGAVINNQITINASGGNVAAIGDAAARGATNGTQSALQRAGAGAARRR